MSARHVFLAIAIVGFAATAAAAQGGVTVMVADNEGLPLPGATVTISHNLGYVKPYAVLSDPKGRAEFPVLRPGAGYTVEVSFPGFNTMRLDVRVDSGKTSTVAVRMMEELQERVKVVAESEVIDLDTTSQVTRFSEDFVSDLPVPGRFYQNVLTMAPGVQDADGDGNPNVHGSRSRDFQALVSGVSNVDPLTGQQGNSRVNPNSIEEMQVITAGAGVEYRRAQGGFVNIVQKQGSNTHEGVAEFYYRTSKLDGDGAEDDSGLPDAEFEWIQPNLHFSGPLIRDKLWYTASLEMIDIETPVNVTTGIEVTKQEAQTNDFGVTWQVSPRNKLKLQYRMEPLETSNLLVSNLTSSESSLSIDRDVQTTTLTWTAPYSPKVLVESLVAWSDGTVSVFPNTADRANSCISGVDFLEDAYCQNLDTGRISGSYYLENSDHRQRLTMSGKATVYGGRFWGMSHQFKLGVSSENERYFRDQTARPQLGYFVVSSLNEDTTGQGEQLESFGVGVVNISVPESDDVRATGTNWGFYAEDQFKPRQNLTVTLGARVDREEISSEGHEPFDPAAELDTYLAEIEKYVDPTSSVFGLTSELQTQAVVEAFTGYEDFASFQSQLISKLCDAGDPGCQQSVQLSIKALSTWQEQLNRVRRKQDLEINSTNVSPYLSLAWDPFSNGKMAFKFAAGRHYNNIPLTIPLQELVPAQATLVYRVDFGGDSGGQVGLQNGISPSVNVSVVDPDIQTPYQDEFTISFERELWTETALSLTYINRKFRDQIQDQNINSGIGDYGACKLQQSPSQVTLEEKWGTGTVTDPHTNQTYEDTDPGPGDGRLDDCIGDELPYRPSGEDPPDNLNNLGVLSRPDGVVDIYRLNPFWGDIYVIGNFNEIDYEGWELVLDRRQYRNWQLNGSYVFSEAKGDGEDFFQGFDDDATVLQQDVSGYQSYDQRHVVKVNATTITPWGVRLGTSTSWQSGLPYSLLYAQAAFDAMTPQTQSLGVTSARARTTYPTGTRNDQRNQSYWNVDLNATKEFNLGRGLNLQLSVEVFNVLDDGTYQVYNPVDEDGQQVNGVNEATRRFGRFWQLGMKLAF